MLIPWTAMHDELLAEVPGCSGASATVALRRAAQRFCERTHAWRAKLDPLVTAANIDTYDINISLEQEVVKLLSATLAGADICVLLADQFDNRRPGVVMLNQRQCSLQPAPAAGQELVMTVILKPSNTAVGIEDFLYAMYADTLHHGAKAELFGMKNQPFTDLMASADERGLFDAEIGRAKIRVATAYGAAPLRVRPSFM